MSSGTDDAGHPMDIAVRKRVATHGDATPSSIRKRHRASSSSLESGEVAPSTRGSRHTSSYTADSSNDDEEDLGRAGVLGAGRDHHGGNGHVAEMAVVTTNDDEQYKAGQDLTGEDPFVLPVKKKKKKKKKKRKKTMVDDDGTDGDGGGGHQQRHTQSASPALTTSGGDVDSDDHDDHTRNTKRHSHAKHAQHDHTQQQPAQLLPVGVELYDDADGVQGGVNQAVQQLLRQPRYFDEGDISAARGPRCFRCGGVGHMIKDCTSDGSEKPCFLCAHTGHLPADCPNTLCFRCGCPGHKSTSCPNPERAAALGACLRCGSRYCKASNAPDFVRAAGGCTDGYHPDDVQRVQCYVCGKYGHMCCMPIDAPVPTPSCFNCGAQHPGVMCDLTPTPPVRAERASAQRGRYAVSEEGGRSGSRASGVGGYRG